MTVNRSRSSGASGSSPRAVRPEIPNEPADRRERLQLLVALAWMLGFFLFFYSFTLPNDPNGISRIDLWMLLPRLLPPPPVNNGAPYGWSNLPQRFDLALVAGVILAGAWGAGHLALRALKVLLPRRGAERTVFALGVGLAALSLATLACGLAGLLERWLLGGLIALAIAAECGLRIRGRDPSSVETDAQPAERAGMNLRSICLLVAAPFVLVMFLGAMLPPVDFDVRAYHLVGPKEFFNTGRITFLPHNVYTSFPFLTEMLCLLGMVLRNDWYRGAMAGQAVLAAFAPLTAVALYAAGRRWFSPRVGWMAAAIHLTTPWIYRISIIAYAEGGLTFYLFATLLAVAIGIEQFGQEKPAARRAFLLAGLLAGSAMACKYTGLVQVVIPLGLAVLAAPLAVRPLVRLPWSSAVPPVLCFSAGVALTIGPWLLKNALETGNPVYPLAYSIFGGRDWDADLNAKWKHAHSAPNYAISDVGAKVIDVTAKSDWLSPLLYGLAPLSLLVTRHRRRIGALWLYAAFLFWAYWLFTHRIDRFWVPMIPVISLLAGIGAGWSPAPAWRWGGGVLALAAVWFNLGFVTTALCGNNAYLSDLEAARRSVENDGIGYLNRTLPPGSKVLCVGEGDVFNARFPLVYNTVFDRSIFQEWCAQDLPGVPAGELPLRDAAEIRRRLAEEGITHVYVNWQWILTYRQPGNYGYTDFVSPRRFAELQRLQVLGKPLLPETSDPRDWGIFFLPYDQLSEKDRPGVDEWGPELRTRVSGIDAVSIRQIFPVLR